MGGIPMSTEGIPTPRTDKAWFSDDGKTDWESYLIMTDLAYKLERELHCANQKLQAIREVVEHRSGTMDVKVVPTFEIKEILNS